MSRAAAKPANSCVSFLAAEAGPESRLSNQSDMPAAGDRPTAEVALHERRTRTGWLTQISCLSIGREHRRRRGTLLGYHVRTKLSLGRTINRSNERSPTLAAPNTSRPRDYLAPTASTQSVFGQGSDYHPPVQPLMDLHHARAGTNREKSHPPD
jgi:hypothetical protein